MVAYATSPLHPGMGASSLVPSSLSGLMQGYLRHAEPLQEGVGPEGVINVHARRVHLEDAGAQRADYAWLDVASGGILQPLAGTAERGIDIEKEMRREPFMYERSATGKGFVLKSAPIMRGIFINTQA